MWKYITAMKPSFIFKYLALLTLTLGVDVQALSTNPDDVEFYLYANPSDTTDAQKIVYRDPNSLIASTFDCTQVTKIIIHGFGGNGTVDDEHPGIVKREYLKLYGTRRYNIFTVDYWKLAEEFTAEGYPAAIGNTPIVGGRIADFIIWLREICEPELGLVHLVAHSLGCVVAGWAGSTVIDKTGSPIDRISGLDPAGPFFWVNIEAANIRHLKPGDASFIDVYHTSSELGNPEKEGMADFYINGAIAPQPGCSNTSLTDPLNRGCNHAISTVYWAKSIAGDPNDKVCVCNYVVGQMGQCCQQKIVIQEYCNPHTRGTFYVPLPAP